MGLYKDIPYVVGEASSLLQCDRVADKIVKVRRNLPGNIIVVHGVNDVGTCYQAVEEGLCTGLEKRLSRRFAAAQYSNPQPQDKARLEPDPDAVFFKRKTDETTNSPVIPFYWGYRETTSQRKTANGQFTDRYGNRLDKDLSKGGGPFINATSTLPDMWNRGVYSPVDLGGDPVRPLKTGPGRLYMVLAAKRLAALISMIRDYHADETVTLVAHSQGCMLSLLAQAMLMEMGLAPADTLILTHPPYSLVDDVSWKADCAELFGGGSDDLMAGHYDHINGRQTLHARLQTLVNIVQGVAGKTDGARKPEFSSLNDHCQHRGMVGEGWKAQADRDNRGKVYLYFSPEDMTVALENVQGIGWQGVPDYIGGQRLMQLQESPYDYQSGRRKVAGPIPYYPVTVPAPVERQALHELGKHFYQRVFTAKHRFDPLTGKTGPVLVGQAPHDFALCIKGEDEHAHVEASGRTLRAKHTAVTWPVDPKKSPVERSEGVRKITGEPLRTPVAADLRGKGQIDPQDIPKNSSHAGLSAKDRGPCEEVDPIDAAIATANVRLGVTVEERPDPAGGVRHGDNGDWQQELPPHQLKEMTERYNKEKHFDAVDDKRTIIRALRQPNGKVFAHVQESPNEARLRWQHEVSAKSFHGGIVGSAKNHEQVTAYDVAIGGGKASSHPLFYAYLCAVADWRLKKMKESETLRAGILEWTDFTTKFDAYWKSELPWRKELIDGNAVYYSNGVLPSCVPLFFRSLWSIVISETMNGKRIQVRDRS